MYCVLLYIVRRFLANIFARNSPLKLLTNAVKNYKIELPNGRRVPSACLTESGTIGCKFRRRARVAGNRLRSVSATILKAVLKTIKVEPREENFAPLNCAVRAAV